jgi:hypothetical protein
MGESRLEMEIDTRRRQRRPRSPTPPAKSRAQIRGAAESQDLPLLLLEKGIKAAVGADFQDEKASGQHFFVSIAASLMAQDDHHSAIASRVI